MIKLLKFIREHKFIFLALLITTSIAYGQTLNMYFWIDDNAVIYKLQHLNQNIGYWGSGITGSGPYRHIIDQFIPFYPFFKTNPTPYYAVGVALYFLASVSVYLFVRMLTKNKLLSFASALIFASGYVGSESIFGITNSWQTLRGIIMALGTFALYYKFIKSRGIKWYIFSVFLFFLSLDTVYIRAHGLIFALAAFDLLYFPIRLKVYSIVKFVFRLAPFAFVHYYIYLTSLAYASGFGILKLVKHLFEDGKFYLLTMPLQDLGNLFIPDIFSKKLDALFRDYIFLHSEVSLFSLAFGIVFTAVTLFIAIKYYQEQRQVVTLFIFSVVWIIANFVIFYLRETNHTLWTTHRYFTYSFVGLAIYWASGASLLIGKRKHLYLFTIGVITVTYAILGVLQQKEINERRSVPARKFFSDFDSHIPNIARDSVLYFSIANNNKIRHEFGSFFGGMFSEGSNLAIYTDNIDYMNEFTFTYKFDDITSFLKEGKTSMDKVYTFYYGENGLVNTTDASRNLLAQGNTIVIGSKQFSSTTNSQASSDAFVSSSDISQEGGKWVGKDVLIIILPENVNSTVPATLKFSMQVIPKLVQLPYQSGEESNLISSQEKAKIFGYIVSASNFKKTAKITAGSFWKEQEPELAIDGRTDTAWRGHRGFWDDIDRSITNNVEFLSVDMGGQKLISQVRWISAQRPLVPIHYKILTSLDGENWQLAKEVKNDQPLPEGTTVTDSFNPANARYVRMEILKTYGNDGPELKEFEVVESKFDKLSQESVEKVMLAPFSKIETLNDMRQAFVYISQNSNLRVYWMANDEDDQDPTKYLDIPIKADGKMHDYSVPLPSSGLSWKKFTLSGFNFPADVSIKSTKLIFEPLRDEN